MVPSGPPTPIGGAQSVTPSLRSNSNAGMLGGQGGQMPSQGGFPSLVSPRTQFNNVNLLGNSPNMSTLLNHSNSFGNGNTNPAFHGGQNGPRGGIDGGAETDSLSGMSNGMGFNNPPSIGSANNTGNPSTSGQFQGGQQFSCSSGNHMLSDQSQPQNFQQSQQQSYQSIRGGLGGGGAGGVPVKLEPQASDQHGGPQQQQLQSLRGLGQVKLEQQQFQNMRNTGSVKMEPQHSDQSLFLQQQQQLLQQISMPRHSPQAAAVAQLNLLQQQKLLQMQQQHQLLKSLPQQRPQSQPQFSPQNLPLRSPGKSVYEPGMCARRLTHYMYQQQHRPEDNSIEFWRKFVTEYFAPNAKKKWCVSMYGSGRQTTGVFPQDVWHCEICKRKPGRGFEASAEVLPRLFKIKYESGTLEELLYVDMPREYQNSSGQIVLDYAKAIQESVFEQLRVVRDGQLRIVFSPELKICSWEFCARRHEELIPRQLLIPQVSQLGTAAQKYQASTQNSSSNTSVAELQSNCNMFVASARQLAKTLEVPLVNDLGYTKRYVRCLQLYFVALRYAISIKAFNGHLEKHLCDINTKISEVVNSMKDLIDYSRLTGEGPMESLARFPRRTSTSSALQGQNQLPEEKQQHSQQPLQQAIAQNANNNNNNNDQGSSSTSHSTIAGLLHQNSMNSRQQNPISNMNSPYGVGSPSQMLSPGLSSTMPSAQQNPSPQTSHGDGDANDNPSSVQKLIQDMMTNQLNGGGGMMGTGFLGSDAKNVNGIGNSGLNMPNGLVGNRPTNSNSSTGAGPFSGMGGGLSQTSTVNGIRPSMGNNPMNGRLGIGSMSRDPSMNLHQQHDLGNQMLNGLGTVNGFNSLPFDWKPSP